jgi:hypothetical protein
MNKREIKVLKCLLKIINLLPLLILLLTIFWGSLKFFRSGRLEDFFLMGVIGLILTLFLMILFLSLEFRGIKKLLKRSRYPCPFYGLVQIGERFIEIENKEKIFCPLPTLKEHPQEKSFFPAFPGCLMIFELKTPNWRECPFNTEEKRKKLLELSLRSRVFPKELQIKKKILIGQGIPLLDWMTFVL